MRRIALDSVSSPIGTVLVAADETGVLAIEFEDCAARLERGLARYWGPHEFEPQRDPHGASHALRRYFAGALDALDALPLATRGPDFHETVWRALRAVPAGTTLGYGALAAKLGRPQAARAVGHANGANPIAIAIPCHRLVGANGALTGYAGGLERKRWLLAHEGAITGE